MPITEDQGLSVVFAAEKDDRDASGHAPLKGSLPGAPPVFYLSDGDPLKAMPPEAVAGTVIIAIFTSVAAWKGSSGIKEEEKNLLGELVKRSRRSIVVSFGSPYLLGDFQEADVLVAAYDKSIQAERSVVRCLTGEEDFTGSLPVDLCLS